MVSLSGPPISTRRVSHADSAASLPTSPATKDNPSSLAPLPYIRSCELCRHRKVKCDRQQPCSHCIRAEADCVYPSGRGRAPKRPRRVLDAQLADRLSRLETIIRRLGKTGAGATPASPPPTSSSPASTAQEKVVSFEGSIVAIPSPSIDIEEHFGSLMIDETRSQYVSNIMWESLANEIDELRDMLLEPASEDENYEIPRSANSSNTSSLGSNAAIFGFRSITHSLQSFHPSLSQTAALFSLFVENVAPLVRIFHMPTMPRIFWDAVASLDSLDKNTEALLFAIYYSAVISIGPEQCVNILVITREVALERYRFAIEQAMARANLLNTQSMLLLQAAVLFLSALRNEDDSRTTWSLTSLIFHIGQTMGLHRDGTLFGLKPFETELRRRLWWHICILDSRSSQYHGYEPVVHEFAFDTKLPLHINDADLYPDMIESPAERDEATDMTFCLIRCEVAMTSRRVHHGSFGTLGVSGRAAESSVSLKDREAMVQELEQRLQEKYLRHCDTTVPYLLISSLAARLIIARFWLVVHYPMSTKRGNNNSAPGPSLDMSKRDQLFLTSIEVLELSSLLLTHKDISKWTWFSKTYCQWQAVAVVLSELCSRPPSPDCDRAWDCVTIVYEEWKMKESEKRGTFWRPIRQLMAKARYIREMQQTDSRRGQSRHQVPIAGFPPAKQASSTLLPSVSSSTPPASMFGVDPTNNHQVVFGMENMDPLMDLFPDSLQVDIFNTPAGNDSFSRSMPFGELASSGWDGW